jgi:hypothetical protein
MRRGMVVCSTHSHHRAYRWPVVRVDGCVELMCAKIDSADSAFLNGRHCLDFGPFRCDKVQAKQIIDCLEYHAYEIIWLVQDSICNVDLIREDYLGGPPSSGSRYENCRVNIRILGEPVSLEESNCSRTSRKGGHSDISNHLVAFLSLCYDYASF